MLEQLLAHLEECTPPKSDFWRCYIRDRAPEAQAEIDRLRRFASKRTGKVADHCNAIADDAQMRLDSVLAA